MDNLDKHGSATGRNWGEKVPNDDGEERKNMKSIRETIGKCHRGCGWTETGTKGEKGESVCPT